jgi:hypothetical protein
MATFAFEQIDGVPDRAWIDVDDVCSVTIIRTDEGVIIDVWPVGADEPFATLGVCDNDIKEEDHAQ